MKVMLPVFKKKPWLVVVGVLSLLVVVGLVAIVWQRSSSSEGSQSSGSVTIVRRGDLIQTTSGSGTLIADKSAELSFSVSGTVGELRVRVGEQVSAGQVLAVLEEVNELKVAVQEKQLALQKAQKTLEDLLGGADQRLAQALADRASAQADYEEARKNLRQKGVPRCSQDQIVSYYYQYIEAQNNVNIWEDYLESGKTGYGRDYILKVLTPMRKERDLAYNNLSYCQGYSEQEILESEANLQLAEAKLRQAEKTYQDLLTHAGIDPDEIAIAEAAVENAELQLKKAQADLEGATLIAPMDGTVISINGEVGEATTGRDTADDADETAFMTLADMEHPAVQVYVDEADLQGFAVGCSALVTFDAIPERVFEGVVTQVSPVVVSFAGGAAEEIGPMMALSDVNVKALQGLVELKDASLTPEKSLVLGLRGTVEITCKKASGVLLIPTAALYEEDNMAYVYVRDRNGEKQKRVIEIGARSDTSVEVRNGLQEGEQVIIR